MKISQQIEGLKTIARRLSGQAGFGLVETLVAVAILGIAAAGFVTDLSAGSIAVGTQDEITVAQALAQTQMEAIKAAPYDKKGDSYPHIAAPDNYTTEITADDSIYARNTIQQVTVTVRHNNTAVLTLQDYKVDR
jgi:prepilin-type N-terminal cleavage/methylation domain-containing protein